MAAYYIWEVMQADNVIIKIWELRTGIKTKADNTQAISNIKCELSFY